MHHTSNKTRPYSERARISSLLECLDVIY